MSKTARSLRAFLDTASSAALVEVAEAKGSTPREKGAWMLVSPERIFGTIGGGQLEFMAIDAARAMLSAPVLSPLEGEMPAKRTAEGVTSGRSAQGALSPAATTPPDGFAAVLPLRGRENLTLDIPLGPEIGQCCGGRVEVAIRPVDAAMAADLVASAEASDAALPQVLVFGGGHVGHALASAFALLPLNVVVVETRADALDGMPGEIDTRLTPVPEEMVREAPGGSAYVVLTHDHALDFLIVAEALKRDDTGYVGMIGSKTKKATFKSWFLKTAGGSEAQFARLVCPIGGDAVKDKRPAVIAALAAAEIMTALANRPA
ncbi:xanthine dehydrogenase accessory protein XdhC [Aminobacter sp. DSM 101952]|uniref:xanthine dehydrogenase accessory protein XdhC n=1 Tax=Aminobacter sp. DSM 101952 TaxID=2735891 RepID=UPI000700F32B|nr:xanthine dehydrogenase accessory protein XdhC [Aminobacter sp. DSM 101952]KQU64930.1 xanthine dehydrogenase accessory protein XdhC [Aminobacter sp. DSM 101952]